MNKDFIELKNNIKPLYDLSIPWFVAGGYAIDLFLGRITRTHNDIDICIFRNEFINLNKFFTSWNRFVIEPSNKSKIKIDAENFELSESQHELHFENNGLKLEFLLTPIEKEQVIFRRDNRIKMHINDFSYRTFDIPHVAPEYQLLYKSKYIRGKDNSDFNHVLPKLSTKQREWLRSGLVVCAGESEWLKYL